jgi:hypothetical protein
MSDDVMVIHDYEDAFIREDGVWVPQFDLGDRIMLQRRAYMSPTGGYSPHRVFVVKKIDPDLCRLSLWDESLHQWDLSDWVTGIAEHGILYKLPRKKKGVPRAVKAPGSTASPLPEGVKRGRGRPPGSKNRTPEQIRADKEAKKLLVASGASRGRGRPRKG